MLAKSHYPFSRARLENDVTLLPVVTELVPVVVAANRPRWVTGRKEEFELELACGAILFSTKTAEL